MLSRRVRALMVTDQQVRLMMSNVRKRPLSVSAAKAGMSEKTARKYRRSGKLPSDCRPDHTWRTRVDPFASVKDEIMSLLKASEPQGELRGTTIFDYLQRTYPGRFEPGQLRTLQRWMRTWRATAGPDREGFFDQGHIPGALAQSDFCHLARLRVTIAGCPFKHLIYHFVMTYSNWEYVQICFSESFEALCEGFQNAVSLLGGLPKRHRTDSLTAAVTLLGNRDEFTARYQALLAHYGLAGEHTQPRHPNEDGDVEQSHHRFVERIDQALMLRGSRDFASRDEYAAFLREHISLANVHRAGSGRFAEEQAAVKALPQRRYDGTKEVYARVGLGSTIKVVRNVYSVHSRLIGERVKVKIGLDHLDVFLGQSMVEKLSRLRGSGHSNIDYRHVIDSLVRKPGAFDQYVYGDALFPTSQFRIAYDALTAARPVEGKKEYLTILKLAADEGQNRVEDALRVLLCTPHLLGALEVKEAIASQGLRRPQDVSVAPIDLTEYDRLLSGDYAALATGLAPSPSGALGAVQSLASALDEKQEVCHA